MSIGSHKAFSAGAVRALGVKQQPSVDRTVPTSSCWRSPYGDQPCGRVMRKEEQNDLESGCFSSSLDLSKEIGTEGGTSHSETDSISDSARHSRESLDDTLNFILRLLLTFLYIRIR